MASITPIVFKKRRKRDGTFTVFIRVTHNRRSAYVNTGVFAFRHETSREGRVTSPTLIAQLLPMVEAMRSRLNPLAGRDDGAPPADVLHRLRGVHGEPRQDMERHPGPPRGFRDAIQSASPLSSSNYHLFSLYLPLNQNSQKKRHKQLNKTT